MPVAPTTLRDVHRRLPPWLQPATQRVYNALAPLAGRGDPAIRERFVDEFLDFRATLDTYRAELLDDEEAPLVQALGAEAPAHAVRSGVSDRACIRLFALIRAHKPETIVETGVCNGVSTLAMLRGLDANDYGRLYSIDWPMHHQRPLDEMTSEDWEAAGGLIPADKAPGWIIPDDLRPRWELTVGKSQRELPRVLDAHAPIDMFIHDSEHSLPCMAMEFELAWEHLRPGGILISDDIGWTDAFDQFCEAREPAATGRVEPGVGYAVIPE